MTTAQTPRYLIFVILVLVVGAFLGGTMRAFGSVRAAVATPTTITTATATATLAPTLIATASSQANKQATLMPTSEETPSPTPYPVSADTTGIISLGFVIFLIVLAGVILGGGMAINKRAP
jgi:hypothetical protein